MKNLIITGFVMCIIALPLCARGEDVPFPLGSQIKITNKNDKEYFDTAFNDLYDDVVISFIKRKSKCLKNNCFYEIRRIERVRMFSFIIAIPKASNTALILTENLDTMNKVIQAEKLDINNMTNVQIAELVKEAIKLTTSPQRYIEVLNSIKELEYKKSKADVKRKAKAEKLLEKVINPIKVTKENDKATAILYLVKYEDIVKRTVNIKKDGTLKFTDEVIGKRLAPTQRGYL